MNVPALTLAIRAVSAAFARRIFNSVVFILIFILTAALAGGIYLVTLNVWWWLFLVPIIVLVFIAGIAATIIWFIIHLLRPEQTKEQKKLVGHFVDVLQETSDAIQTPKLVLLFRLIKDIVVPGKQTLITQISGNASTLNVDFKKIVSSFSK